MPLDGNGTASKPAGTTAVPNTVIDSSKFNSVVDDIYAIFNAARPIAYGGTGGNSPSSARQGLTTFISKSSTYVAVKTDAGAIHNCLDAFTIDLTAAATLGVNWTLTVVASNGAIVIDPASSELINGSATLTIANGDSAYIICTGSAFKAIVISSGAKYALKTANYTALDADTSTSLRFTSAATLSFDVTANLRTNWRIELWNDSTGLVTIDPDSTDTINGATTLILQPRQKAEIFKTGATTFQASIFGDQLSGPQLQGYLFGLALTTNASDAANDVDIATGAAGSDTSPYYLMQLASALTKRIDASWAAGNNQGGLDTGSVTNATYYIWIIQRSDTLVTDALFSLSNTTPTMPTNYDRKRLVGFLLRSSATNATPTNLGRPEIQYAGSAPIYPARTHVLFNGTGTPAIIGGGNVASITDLGTGNYRINFTTAMPNANYTRIAGVSSSGGVVRTQNPTTTTVDVITQSTAGTAYDDPGISVVIY